MGKITLTKEEQILLDKYRVYKLSYITINSNPDMYMVFPNIEKLLSEWDVLMMEIKDYFVSNFAIKYQELNCEILSQNMMGIIQPYQTQFSFFEFLHVYDNIKPILFIEPMLWVKSKYGVLLYEISNLKLI